MNKEGIKNQWIERVCEFDKGNESRKEFCGKRKINYRQFNYWYERHGQKSKSKKNVNNKNISVTNKEKASEINTGITAKKEIEWIEVKIESESLKKEEKSQITIKIGKAEIKIEKGFNKALLTDAVKVLGELC